MQSGKILLIFIFLLVSYSSCTPEELNPEKTEFQSTGDDTDEDIDDKKD